MSLPAIQFYIGDWMKDSGIRAASLEARGLWVDMLCLMNESPVTGKLLLPSGGGISPATLARITGVHPSRCLKILAELEGLGVFSTDENGVIYSRRMIKDAELREQKRLAGLKGGNPNLLKHEVKQSINQPEGVFSSSSIQSSSSLQTSVKENNISPSAPAADAAVSDILKTPHPKSEYSPEFEAVWSAYPAPYRGNRKQAFKAWKAIKASNELQLQIIEAIEGQIEARAKIQSSNPKAFIPRWKLLATWLNNACWADEIIADDSEAEPFDASNAKLLAEEAAENQRLRDMGIIQ